MSKTHSVRLAQCSGGKIMSAGQDLNAARSEADAADHAARESAQIAINDAYLAALEVKS